MTTGLDQSAHTDKSNLAPIRIDGVDACRAIMALFVIFLHSIPFTGPTGSSFPMQLLILIFRAAVPFFFLASGYFLKVEKRPLIDMVQKPLIRLLPIYVFWVSVYLCAARILPGHDTSFHFRDIASGGPGFHLWFLPALGVSMAIVAVGLNTIGWSSTGIVCASLALICLARGSYHDVLHLSGSAARGGLFIAPMFVYLGALIRRSGLRPRMTFCFGGIILSIILIFTEESLISIKSGNFFLSHDFIFSTFILGTSSFMLALSLKYNAIVGSVARIGKYSLGIYASHLLFLWLLFPITGTSVQFAFINAALAFAAGCLLGATLGRLPLLGRFVT